MGMFVDQVSKLKNCQIEAMLFCLADKEISEALRMLNTMPGGNQHTQMLELKKIVAKRKIVLPLEHKNFLKRMK